MASIERGPLPTDNFTILSNAWLRDKRLSWRARGVLAWLASHSQSFKVSEARIVAASDLDGRHTVRQALSELEELGYLIRTKDHGIGGRFTSATYRLSDPDSTIVRSTDNGGSDDGGSDRIRKLRSKKTTEEEEQAASRDHRSDDPTPAPSGVRRERRDPDLAGLVNEIDSDEDSALGWLGKHNDFLDVEEFVTTAYEKVKANDLITDPAAYFEKVMRHGTAVSKCDRLMGLIYGQHWRKEEEAA